MCFLIHVHDQQKDCSRFTAASNARKALRNARIFFHLGPSLEIWDSDSVKQMAKQPDDLAADDTRDAKMGPLHQVALETLALPGTVLVDRRATPARTFMTLKPRQSTLLTPTGGVALVNSMTQTSQDARRLFEIQGSFPEEGVDSMGLHMIRLHALRCIWATRNVEMHRTMIEEVVPRSATQPFHSRRHGVAMTFLFPTYERNRRAMFGRRPRSLRRSRSVMRLISRARGSLSGRSFTTPRGRR